MKVLLAIDDSLYAELATRAVAEQFRPDSTEVCVFHAVEPLLPFPGMYKDILEETRRLREERLKEANQLVTRAEKKLRDAGFKASTTVVEEDAKVAILDFAAEWKPDLIVVGSQGRKGWDRFLLGSVSERVARHARCSVQIVRKARWS